MDKDDNTSSGIRSHWYEQRFDGGSVNITFGVTPITPPFPEIKKVIFNDPHTIVIWSDDSKTIVKCGPDDRFSEDIGLAMAVVKKLYGGRCRYQKLLKSKAERQITKVEYNGKKRTLKTK